MGVGKGVCEVCTSNVLVTPIHNLVYVILQLFLWSFQEPNFKNIFNPIFDLHIHPFRFAVLTKITEFGG